MTKNETNTIEALATFETDHSFCNTCFLELWEKKAADAMLIYIPPFLILFGTLGNLMTLIVLQNRMYRASPTVVALSALALADILVLNTGLMRHWIEQTFKVNIRDLNNVGCKLHVGLTYVSITLSANFLALTTVERTISVWFPLKVKELVSKPRMIVLCGIVTVVCFSIYIPMFIRSRIAFDPSYGMAYCGWHDLQFYNIYYWVAFTFEFFIPMGVIFLGNILLIAKLTQAARKRASVMNVSDETNKSATIMLLLVGMIFILTIAPANIYFLGVGYGAWAMENEVDYARGLLAYSFTNLLTYVNSSINFLLYCVSGTRFRSALKSIFCKKIDESKSMSKTNSMELE